MHLTNLQKNQLTAMQYQLANTQEQAKANAAAAPGMPTATKVAIWGSVIVGLGLLTFLTVKILKARRGRAAA